MHIIRENGYDIAFLSTFDDRRRYETQCKGYLFDLYVIIEKKSYNIIFYDKMRLEQDIDAENERYGYGFFYSKNIVVVKEITYDEIVKAINHLIKIDFFSTLKEDKLEIDLND
ncbi:hypothetical protein [Bartonella sp. HY761]|uniref:hypothetical protein n=1 Tax=Bartonella sp. HY761 TaxID=2979330 RepID=UPI0021FC86E5|nr:hypothetical protein [Bartonella sp. HY761]UXN06964.1 hypothetical protein N6A79_02845 [Bartonella sp. HY761]